MQIQIILNIQCKSTQTKETNNFGGGRVFHLQQTQDGNFRVGDLFSIEQSTGIATLNADAFNISGLNQLELGSVELGGTGATITEFLLMEHLPQIAIILFLHKKLLKLILLVK